MNLGKSLGHSDDGFHVSDTNLEPPCDLGFPSQLSIEGSELVLVNLLQLGLDVSSGVYKVLLQKVVRNQIFVVPVHPVVGQELSIAKFFRPLLVFQLSLREFFAHKSLDYRRMILHVRVNHKSGQSIIVVFVDLVSHNS